MSKTPTRSVDWSSESRDLIRAARGDHGPTSADRARVRDALAERLAESSNLPPAEADSGAVLLGRAGGRALTMDAVKLAIRVACIVAGAYAFLRVSESRHRPIFKPALRTQAEAEALAAPRSGATSRLAVPPVAAAATADAALGAGQASKPSHASGPALAAPQLSAADEAARKPQSGARTKAAEARTGHSPAANAREERASRSSAAVELESRRSVTAARVAAISSRPSGDALRSRSALADAVSGSRSKAGPSPSAPDAPGSRSTSTSTEAAPPAHDSAAPPAHVSPPSAAEPERAHAATSGRLLPAQVARATDASDARAEVVFVSRINAALRTSQLRVVLALCAEHERRWPHGTFVQERDGLFAIASCRAGAADAAGVARSFLTNYPRAPLAPRVRDACASQLTAATKATRDQP